MYIAIWNYEKPDRIRRMCPTVADIVSLRPAKPSADTEPRLFADEELEAFLRWHRNERHRDLA